MNLAHIPVKELAVGMSGMGKTLYINERILRSDYRFYFIFDHEGQFTERNRIAGAYTRAQVLEQLTRRRFVVFNPSEMFLDPAEALNWFCSFAYQFSEKARGPKVLYVDEIQDVINVRLECPYWVRKVLVSGRNKELDFFGTSLQYNMVHNAIRGQATNTIAFCTDEPLALKDLIARGFRTHEVAALQPGQFISRDKRQGEARGWLPPHLLKLIQKKA